MVKRISNLGVCLLAAILILAFTLSGCALNQLGKPIIYDNATISTISDHALLSLKTSDKDFVPILTSRLNEFTKAEVVKQGRLKVTSACAPRTLKVVQEITGITVKTVTDVDVSAKIFQFKGKGSSTITDNFTINTTTTVIDCESGKTLGIYDYQYEGPNPIDLLQTIAGYNVWCVYVHQRG
ncbi:MAG TPA: hypothetical protein P5347_01155 [Smithellaceae bacterium]|nr:hypothetical protein [Smithellaceae bacterium]